MYGVQVSAERWPNVAMVVPFTPGAIVLHPTRVEYIGFPGPRPRVDLEPYAVDRSRVGYSLLTGEKQELPDLTGMALVCANRMAERKRFAHVHDDRPKGWRVTILRRLLATAEQEQQRMSPGQMGHPSAFGTKDGRRVQGVLTKDGTIRFEAARKRLAILLHKLPAQVSDGNVIEYLARGEAASKKVLK